MLELLSDVENDNDPEMTQPIPEADPPQSILSQQKDKWIEQIRKECDIRPKKNQKTQIGLAWYPHTPRPQHAPRKLIKKWTTCLSKPKGLEPTSFLITLPVV